MTVVLTKVVHKSVFGLKASVGAGLESDHFSTISISTHPPYYQDLIEFVSLLLESNALMTFFFELSCFRLLWFRQADLLLWPEEKSVSGQTHIQEESSIKDFPTQSQDEVITCHRNSECWRKPFKVQPNIWAGERHRIQRDAFLSILKYVWERNVE